MSASIAVVGRNGSGKTTLVKNKLLKGKKVYIYDVNNEYGVTAKSIEDLLIKVNTLRNTVITVEESTFIFSNRSHSKELLEALVKRRHYNNSYIFIFHSVRSIPTYVFNLLEYVYLFKTNDTKDILINRFGEIHYNNVRKYITKKFDYYLIRL